MEANLHHSDLGQFQELTSHLARKYSGARCIIAMSDFSNQVRLLNAFRFVLRSERSRTPMTPDHLFQPLITESHGSLMELDYNIHS